MSNEKIWAYLVHFGENMWGDFELEAGPECKKTEPLSFHMPTWHEISDSLLKAGCCNTILIDVADCVEYEKHPEIKVPGALSKKQLSDEIDRLRGLGFKVYPKLNFSACHDKWMGIYSRMVSTPAYYQFCNDVIDEVSELFGNPELFHLGLDEECYSTQTTSPMCIIRGYDLYWHDVNYLFKITEKNGSRPWMWADHVWHTPESEKVFLKNMTKDVLLSNWYYGDWKHTEGFFVDSMRGYRVLEENGFDQLPAGGNFNGVVEYCYDSMRLTVENCSKIIAPERLKGFMMTNWEKTNAERKPRLVEAVNALTDGYNAYYNK